MRCSLAFVTVIATASCAPILVDPVKRQDNLGNTPIGPISAEAENVEHHLGGARIEAEASAGNEHPRRDAIEVDDSSVDSNTKNSNTLVTYFQDFYFDLTNALGRRSSNKLAAKRDGTEGDDTEIGPFLTTSRTSVGGSVAYNLLSVDGHPSHTNVKASNNALSRRKRDGGSKRENPKQDLFEELLVKLFEDIEDVIHA